MYIQLQARNTILRCFSVARRYTAITDVLVIILSFTFIIDGLPFILMSSCEVNKGDNSVVSIADLSIYSSNVIGESKFSFCKKPHI